MSLPENFTDEDEAILIEVCIHHELFKAYVNLEKKKTAVTKQFNILSTHHLTEEMVYNFMLEKEKVYKEYASQKEKQLKEAERHCPNYCAIESASFTYDDPQSSRAKRQKCEPSSSRKIPDMSLLNNIAYTSDELRILEQCMRVLGPLCREGRISNEEMYAAYTRLSLDVAWRIGFLEMGDLDTIVYFVKRSYSDMNK